MANKPSLPPVMWYALSGVLLVFTLLVCAYSAALFFFPRSPLNPLPPFTRTPAPLPTLALVTATPPVSFPTLPPTWTPDAGGQPDAPVLLPTPTPLVTLSFATPDPNATLAAPPTEAPIGAPTEAPIGPPTEAPIGVPTETPVGGVTSEAPVLATSASTPTPTSALPTFTPAAPGPTSTPRAGYP